MRVNSIRNEKTNRWLWVLAAALGVWLIVGLGALIASCGGTSTTTTTTGATATTVGATTTTEAATTTTTQPVTATEAVTTTTQAAGTAPMSKTEVAQWKKDAIAFNDRLNAAFPHAAAQFAQFADDVEFYDPSDGDFIMKGKATAVRMQQGFNDYAPDIKFHRTATYLSGDAAAHANSIEHLWPPWVPEPASHPAVDDLEVFRFRGGQVVGYDIWFAEATLKMISFGWFASGKGGPERLQKIADEYLAAWSSGDKARIAGLYRDDAIFTDTMLGLQAQGAAAISELRDKRFGSADKVTFEIIGLYAQTNGYAPPTDEIPGNGAVIAVGIHYRCTLVMGGKSTTVEGLTTFELGDRQGKSFAPDPNGLITREEVFYDPDSIMASGLLR